VLARFKFFHQRMSCSKTHKMLPGRHETFLSGQDKNLAVVECDYVCKQLGEVLSVLGVNGNELARLQRCSQLLQVGNGACPLVWAYRKLTAGSLRQAFAAYSSIWPTTSRRDRVSLRLLHSTSVGIPN
jgi:hypothetical protein